MIFDTGGSQTVVLLLTFGMLFLVGLAADLLGRHSPLPRVTVLLLVGFAIGPGGMDWLPAVFIDQFPLVTAMALAMVGFLLGQELTWRRMQKLGRAILSISVAVVLVTAMIVCLGLTLFGVPLPVALILGGIAMATDPAATIDVVREHGANNSFSRTLLGVVAIDDAWCLIFFSIMLGIAEGLLGKASVAGTLIESLQHIGVAVLIGLVIGLPLAMLTGRIRPGEPALAEALGGVLLTAGIAEWFDVSPILACMVLGVAVANLAKHHKRPFRAIEGIEWLFLILFFLLAGASIDQHALQTVGSLGALYVGWRIIGRVLGAFIGAKSARSPQDIQRWAGLALLPQAGVAIGLALLASQRLPELADTILPIAIASTMVFEIVGPIATKAILIKSNTKREPSP